MTFNLEYKRTFGERFRKDRQVVNSRIMTEDIVMYVRHARWETEGRVVVFETVSG